VNFVQVVDTVVEETEQSVRRLLDVCLHGEDGLTGSWHQEHPGGVDLVLQDHSVTVGVEFREAKYEEFKRMLER
jgi:hypothetical protein